MRITAKVVISITLHYPSGAHEFTPGFYRLLWFFSVSIVLSVLRFTASAYPFGIFKLFFDLISIQ
jgi:hypothetical protein